MYEVEQINQYIKHNGSKFLIAGKDSYKYEKAEIQNELYAIQMELDILVGTHGF